MSSPPVGGGKDSPNCCILLLKSILAWHMKIALPLPRTYFALNKFEYQFYIMYNLNFYLGDLPGRCHHRQCLAWMLQSGCLGNPLASAAGFLASAATVLWLISC